MSLHAGAQTFDAAADFSPNQNPHGVWSYGLEFSLGGTFSADGTPTNLDSIDYWSPSAGSLFPNVSHNGTDAIQQGGGGSTATWQPNQLALHPGSSGEFSILRFTAPSNGDYQVSGVFTGIDSQGTTTDIHLLWDNTPLFNSSLNLDGHGNDSPFSTTVSLATGDTMDFVVGWGNGTPTSDTTALAVTISAVPEPNATGMLLASGCFFTGWRRRRK